MNFNLEIKNFLKIFEKEKYNRQNLRMLCQDFFDKLALKQDSEFEIEKGVYIKHKTNIKTQLEKIYDLLKSK